MHVRSMSSRPFRSFSGGPAANVLLPLYRPALSARRGREILTSQVCLSDEDRSVSRRSTSQIAPLGAKGRCTSWGSRLNSTIVVELLSREMHGWDDASGGVCPRMLSRIVLEPRGRTGDRQFGASEAQGTLRPKPEPGQRTDVQHRPRSRSSGSGLRLSAIRQSSVTDTCIARFFVLSAPDRPERGPVLDVQEICIRQASWAHPGPSWMGPHELPFVEELSQAMVAGRPASGSAVAGQWVRRSSPMNREGSTRSTRPRTAHPGKWSSRSASNPSVHVRRCYKLQVSSRDLSSQG